MPILPDLSMALRYLGAADAPPSLRAQMAQEAQRLAQQCPPRWVWCVYRPAGLESRTASTMLEGCHTVCALVCTLGASYTAFLCARQARGMDGAVMLDACASALVEAGCDAAEAEISARFPAAYLTDRFSPGYGDVPLSLQMALLAATDAERRLGVTLTQSLLLNPQKTVTALIGVSDQPQRARIRGCAYCSFFSKCDYRKGGTCCERL